MKRDPFFDLIHLILTSEENEKKKIIKYINNHLKKKKISSSDAKALKLIYGGGLYQKLANVYRANYCDGKARPLEGKELHPLCMNYLGPYTEIDKYPNYPPYNDVDNCARNHDFAYKEAFDKPKEERQKLVRDADEIFLNCIEKYKDQQAYDIGKAGIQGKIRIENLLPESVDLSNYQGKETFGLQGQGFSDYLMLNKILGREKLRKIPKFREDVIKYASKIYKYPYEKAAKLYDLGEEYDEDYLYYLKGGCGTNMNCSCN